MFERDHGTVPVILCIALSHSFSDVGKRTQSDSEYKEGKGTPGASPLSPFRRMLNFEMKFFLCLFNYRTTHGSRRCCSSYFLAYEAIRPVHIWRSFCYGLISISIFHPRKLDFINQMIPANSRDARGVGCWEVQGLAANSPQWYPAILTFIAYFRISNKAHFWRERNTFINA